MRTVFQEVAGCFLRVLGKGVELLWSQSIFVTILAKTRLGARENQRAIAHVS